MLRVSPAFRRRGGRAALLLVAALAGACDYGTAPRPSRPDVVLVTIDTLRADHLGVYGYPIDTSPNLDRLAAESTVYTACYSQSAATAPSHATMFTARYPQSTGVLSNTQQFPELPSLPSLLRDAGYATAGFVSSRVVGRQFGIQRLFDHFDDQPTAIEINRRDRGERPAEATVKAALDYLDRRDDSRPLFLWLHLIDPHGPYEAPRDADRFVGNAHYAAQNRAVAIGATNWAWDEIPAYQTLRGSTDAAFYLARYDGEIRYVDDALGAFFAGLKQRSIFDDSFLVVTADHGETLLDVGHKRLFSHGTVAYEEVVRVPLIIREPAGGERLRDSAKAPARLLDLAPTLLALLGQPLPSTFQGRDLLTGPRRGESIFSFGSYGTKALESRIGTQFTVRKGPYRYLLNTQDRTEELFDHRIDPAESRNLAAAAPEVRARLRAELDRLFASAPLAGAKPIEESPESATALRALGYL